MKRIKGAVVCCLLAVAGLSYGVEANWKTDLDAAKKEAKKTGRTILANFSGSDWCGWCIRLDREVFSKPEFKEFADKNLVLFVADFPRSAEQSEKIKKQNSKVATEYRIAGFPTVLLLNQDGKVLAKTGYVRGGPEKYVEHLRELIKENTAKEQ